MPQRWNPHSARARLGAALISCNLAGCAGLVTREEAVSLTDAELCGEYGDEARDARNWGITLGRPGTFATGPRFDGVVAEIRRRALLREDVTAKVLDGHVDPGMTEIEALCAWGSPIEVTPAADTISSEWTFAAYSGPYKVGTVSVTMKDGHVIAVGR